VEWLLRQWKQEAWLKQENEKWAKDTKGQAKRIDGIQRLIKKDKSKTPPQWYVNSQGQTMLVIPGPVEFLMGSPPTEEGREKVETRHRKRINRTFAISAMGVTVEQYRKFVASYEVYEQWTHTLDSPVNRTNWYQAALYCNWLSQQEGIPEDQWCYETHTREKMSVLASLLLPHYPLGRAAGTSYFFFLDKQLPVTALKKGYLGLCGYRLPTEAEMEYACRAGAVTSWCYGETADLLARYSWYAQNSKERSWPVGAKKPNDLGLFDMHGNLYNWCQDSFKGDYPVSTRGEVIEDIKDSLQIVPTEMRVLRGGSFDNPAVYDRSAARLKIVPTLRNPSFGLRLARALAP
jgi:formylglycine-generating enzyme required for sulfatase activity